MFWKAYAYINVCVYKGNILDRNAEQGCDIQQKQWNGEKEQVLTKKDTKQILLIIF